MRRTALRPVPSGRMTKTHAAAVGLALTLGGSAYLAIYANLLTGLLVFMTSLVYLAAYTPLKKVSPVCTFVGAFPGAMPVVLGWTAVRGRIEVQTLILFAIMFVWQFPHFLSIAWLYREDYKQAGFVMLASFDPACQVTGRQSLLYTMGLISVSFIPAMLELTSFWYLPIAAIMGGYFLLMAFRFAISGTDQAARRLFVASIVYLPITLAALAFARL